jgi:hypothetical protein
VEIKGATDGWTCAGMGRLRNAYRIILKVLLKNSSFEETEGCLLRWML